MRIAIPLFAGFTALDAIGPFEVLHRLPGAEVSLLAAAAGPIATDEGRLTLLADGAFADLPDPDVIVVPGGHGTRMLLDDGELLGWLRHAHAGSRWTTSVCTGALLLAAAGLLDGLDAATHWLAREELAALGARPVARRVVELPEQRIVTAAGVSAGIDMALLLAARLAGEHVAQAIQLSIEYDPEPPFSAGSPDSAPAVVRELLERRAGRRRTAAEEG